MAHIKLSSDKILAAFGKYMNSPKYDIAFLDDLRTKGWNISGFDDFEIMENGDMVDRRWLRLKKFAENSEAVDIYDEEMKLMEKFL